jgi:hypothetical protein
MQRVSARRFQSSPHARVKPRVRTPCGVATGEKRHRSERQSDERNDDDRERDRRHNMEHFKLHRIGLLKMGIAYRRAL